MGGEDGDDVLAMNSRRDITGEVTEGGIGGKDGELCEGALPGVGEQPLDEASKARGVGPICDAAGVGDYPPSVGVRLRVGNLPTGCSDQGLPPVGFLFDLEVAIGDKDWWGHRGGESERADALGALGCQRGWCSRTRE